MYTEYMIFKYTLHLCQLETNIDYVCLSTSCDGQKQFWTWLL
jgi:hypothetical protein